MVRQVCIVLILFCSVVAGQTSFQDFINSVNTASDPQVKSAKIDSFYNVVRQNDGAPYFDDDSTTYFFHRDNSLQSLRVSFYSFYRYFPMTRLDGTDFWYAGWDVEYDARIEYIFVPDDMNGVRPDNTIERFMLFQTSFFDPENNYPNEYCSSRKANLLFMPDYEYPVDIEFNPGIPHGAITDPFILHSNAANYDYKIQMYLPPSYETDIQKRYPVYYVNDGDAPVDTTEEESRMPNTIDYLISESKIREIIAVFIYTPDDRSGHFTGNLRFAYEAFIADELRSHIDTQYRTLADPQYRAVSGRSLGGPITAQITYNRPDIFGNGGLISPSGKPSGGETFPAYEELKNGRKKDIRYYIDYGTYESTENIPYKQVLMDAIIAKGYENESRIWNDGHNQCNFRAHQKYPIMFFFPGESATSQKAPQNQLVSDFDPADISYSVEKNHIEITMNNNSLLDKITLINLHGRIIRNIGIGHSGKNTVSFNIANLARGSYVLKLNTGKTHKHLSLLIMD